MARSGQSGSPQRKPSICFNEKEDVYDDQNRSGGAFVDLDQDVLDDRSKAYHLAPSGQQRGQRPASTSTPESSRNKPDSIDFSSIPPPSLSSKQTTGVDAAAIDRLSQNYVPSPYTFRAPTRVKQLKRITAKCPPFYLQLDHTLAVIWILFSDEPSQQLGVAQLQWALNFLQGIYTRKGEHPKDIALCIQAIEDLLMEKYADMVQEVTAMEEDERRKRRKKSVYLGSEASLKSKPSVCDSEMCFGRMSLDIDREIVEEAELLIKQVPFSVNYSEMTEKAGTDIEQLYSKHSKASTDASGLDFDVPQENTMEFLRQWRRDQIHKIQSELKRLHSIEAYIGCAETNFDNVDPKKFDTLLGTEVAATRKKPKNYP